MNKGPDHNDADDDRKQGITELLSQLGDDATEFARAEIRYLQVQANERATIAVPALFMLAASAVLMLAVVVAVMVAAILLIAPYVGTALAVIIVIILASLCAFALYRAGRERMRRVFEKLEA